MSNFFESLCNVLKQDERFFSVDGKLLRNAAVEAANKFDAKLLKLLLADEKIAQRFFVEVEGVKVFKAQEFSWAINNYEFLPGSFTRYKNKIGLVDSRGDFISQTSNVELVFPYKDCVLEGGQTKDEQKRAEIFYNETLAVDEVDRLFEPKVLTCAKKFSAEGVQAATNFSDTDNLIIKGNNLLALASLLKRFQNKIKCIYIDPPYNTGNDSFNYNDRFSRSAWLTFMKNRLELAKKLLRNDGLIFIQIDNHEQAYLKVLCDEILGEKNFVQLISIKRASPAGFKVVNPGPITVTEYILLYAKNKSSMCYIPQRVAVDYDKNYDSYIVNPEEPPQNWKIEKLTAILYKRWGVSDWRELKQKLGENWKVIRDSALGELAIELKDTVVSVRDPHKPSKIIKTVMNESRNNKGKVFVIERENNTPIFIYDGGALSFYRDKLKIVDGVLTPTELLTDFWDDISYSGIADEGKTQFKNSKKPEMLIKRVLELCTKENDIVLDFFLGSGTTAAVAHKMRRQYIGVEQMDYIETVTLERLKKVIAGEQGGISKAVNWSGGGSFIYCELAKLNQNFVEEIQATKDFDTIWAIYQRMIDSGYISYKVDTAKVAETVDDFKNLTLEEQQRLLMEILDKNLLYVNYCDMDDAEFEISAADKNFSQSFYGD